MDSRGVLTDRDIGGCVEARIPEYTYCERGIAPKPCACLSFSQPVANLATEELDKFGHQTNVQQDSILPPANFVWSH